MSARGSSLTLERTRLPFRPVDEWTTDTEAREDGAKKSHIAEADFEVRARARARDDNFAVGLVAI